MPKKDINQLAKFLVDQATGEIPPKAAPTGKAKSGRQGGLIGGRARANKLTPEELSIAGKKAIAARWKKN